MVQHADIDHTGVTGAGAAAHIADAADAHDASAISVLDTAANFTGTDVEAVLAELQDNIDGVGGGSSGNRYVYVSFLSKPVATTGFTPTLDVTAGIALGGYALSSAQNDFIEYDVLLESGTYELVLIHHRHTTRGIYTVTMDGGASLGTIDGYNAGGGLATRSTITGIVVGTTAIHTFRFAMLTKNGSSSNYLGTPNAFTLTRTGA
jgi:hypothetical protein